MDFNAFYMSPDRFLFLTLIGIFIIQLCQRKTRRVPVIKAEILMVFFFGLCLVSYLMFSPELGGVITATKKGITEEMRGEHKYLASLLNITAYPFLSFIIARRVKYPKKSQSLLLIALSIIGLYLIIITLLQHFEIYTLVWPKYIEEPITNLSGSRVGGPFADPITMGFMLLLVFLCYMLISSQSRGSRRIMFYVAAVLAGISIYFVYTRSVWLCFAMSLVILTVKKSGMRDISRLIVIGIVVFSLIGVGSKFSFLGKTLFSTRHETVSYRLINYSVALRAIEKNPIFGIGWGKFDSEFRGYVKAGEEIFKSGYDGNHNTFLGIAAEVGVIGGFIFLGILYYMLIGIRNAQRKVRGAGSLKKDLLASFVALMCAYMVVASFVDLRYTLMVNVAMFLFSGILYGIVEGSNKQRAA